MATARDAMALTRCIRAHLEARAYNLAAKSGLGPIGYLVTLRLTCCTSRPRAVRTVRDAITFEWPVNRSDILSGLLRITGTEAGMFSAGEDIRYFTLYGARGLRDGVPPESGIRR